MRRALLVYVLFAIIATWPQTIRPDAIPDHEDSYFSLWRLAWIANALTTEPGRLFDGNIFHPERHTLAYSDAVLLEGAVALPFISAGVPVVYVYNGLVVGSFVACGLAMFLLARRLTGSWPAALLAGAAFAFAPFRFDHYQHLELLWSPWMPLAFWLAHRTVESGRVRDGIATGFVVALQVLSCIYYCVFLSTVLVVFVIVMLAGRVTAPRALVAFACGGALAAVLTFPYMIPYWQARDVVGERNPGEASLHSAGPRHYFASLPENVVWGPLTGSLGRHEKRLWPGLIVLGLVALALWPPVTRTTVAYALVLALAIDVSFGPKGLSFDWLREYTVVYRGLRAPARMGQVALLGFAALAAIGFVRLRIWLQSWRLPIGAAAAAVVLIAFAEYLIAPRALVAVPTEPPPAYAWLRDQPGAVVAELPMPSRRTAPLHEPEFQFLSTFHWRPLVNGYSGNWSLRQVQVLDRMEGFPDEDSIAALRELGVTHVLLHERYFGREAYRGILEELSGRSALRFLRRFDDGRFEIAVYLLSDDVRAGAP